MSKSFARRAAATLNPAVGLFLLTLTALSIPACTHEDDAAAHPSRDGAEGPTRAQTAPLLGVFQGKLAADVGGVNDFFGYSVAVSGDIAVIGADEDDDKGADAGAAYVFLRVGDTWVQEQKLLAADGAADDHFGISAAIAGTTAVIGSYWDDDAGDRSGSAYVFVRQGNTWAQQAKLVAGDGAENDRFGYSVALSGDTAVVGARWDDDEGDNAGAAYVFTRAGSTWTQQQKLVASDGGPGDWFGYSVAVSDDTAVVGAHFDDDKGFDAGSAYVFLRNGSTWSQQQKLLASDGSAGDHFGFAVAAHDDTVVIGAHGDDDQGANSGSAYVFARNGSTWQQQQKLVAADDDIAEDRFGYSVAVSGDLAVVGANLSDDHGGSSGAAYLFLRTGSTWTQVSKLLDANGAAGDQLGVSVAIAGDTAVVGAYQDDGANGPNFGSAHVFVVRLNDGDPCAASGQCASGQCVDGVCCESACSGACLACSAAKKGHGSDGVCEPVATGADPDDECADEGAASCGGTNGWCDGKGACQHYPDTCGADDGGDESNGSGSGKGENGSGGSGGGEGDGGGGYAGLGGADSGGTGGAAISASQSFYSCAVTGLVADAPGVVFPAGALLALVLRRRRPRAR